MKKITTAALFLMLTGTAFAQEGRVGINTTDPKTTLDVTGKTDTSGNLLTTDMTGLQAPRLTRAELTAKGNTLYGADQKGALVFITDVSGGDATSQRINISATGYYYFDGAVWQPIASGTGAADTTKDSWIDDPTNTTPMVKLGTLSDGTTARTAGTEFVVTDAGKVGIGLTNPEWDLTLKSTSLFGIGLSTDTDRIRLSASALDFYRATHSLIRQKTAGGALRFYTRSLDDSTDDLLLVLRRGSVGIGNLVNPDAFAKFAIKGAGNTDATTAFAIQNSDATNTFTVLDNGNVGIGTTTPGTKLEVTGSIKVGNDGDTATNGTIRYNSTTNKFQGYANGAWVDLH